MKFKYSYIIVVLLLIIIVFDFFKSHFNSFAKTDKVITVVENEKLDVGDYKTITIGKQIWMAENLKVKVKNSFSVENNPINDNIYGRLYTWDAAMKACPTGWRLPTLNDYIELIKCLGSNDAGTKLKIGGDSGFNASLPGYFDHNDSLFYGKGIYGQYWTSDQYHFTDCAWLLYVDSSMKRVDFSWYLSNKDGFSVRYLKDTTNTK